MSLPPALLALAAAAFGIGTTEFVIMGLLPEIGHSLGVSIPQAGQLVSSYALAVTIGSPFMAVLMARFPRRLSLLILMAVFIIGNAFCALAHGYDTLMAARIFTALAHGAFFGIGAVVAAEVVPKHQRAMAISLMFSGLTLANVLGVPFGTLLGQAYGWRTTFWAVVIIGVAAFVALLIWVPEVRQARRMRLKREVAALGHPQVLLAMGTSVLCSAALFTVFTYITPLLETVSGISPHGVSIALLLFGVGITLGNLVGGRLADWRLMPSIILSLCLLIIVQIVFTATSHSAVPAVITIMVWGAFAFGVAPPLQMRVVDQARAAPSLASTMNQSAFNLGNAIGASAGGFMVSAGAGYAQLPWLGSAFSVVALGVIVTALWLERRSQRRRETRKAGFRAAATHSEAA
ncbi:MFS transporter [Acidisoma cladoniae]|uniref:MFS transporter n=1 Tax=Acidisoma cladoniae TaxID=3040935 RepID=UPI00254D3894|nr:MFS transporter [Acidisoma sp. PAMC 29798]